MKFEQIKACAEDDNCSILLNEKGKVIIEEYKKPKLVGKDEDGLYEGRIEQIGTGRTSDKLCISNRKPNLWWASIFDGYRQIGTFNVSKPNNFCEGQDVIVEKKNDKIIKVKVAG